MDTFQDRLSAAVRRTAAPVCVGLDPRLALLPAALRPDRSADPVACAAAYQTFCREVIDVVAPLAPVVKPQAAFFEQLGPPGMAALGQVMRYATSQGLLVLLDGKRNDIGSTATAYAEGWLGPLGESNWGADAMTVSPYLGDDSLAPFVEIARRRSAGVFVLVKTSNPGGAQFQDVAAPQAPLYRRVAEYVESLAKQTARAGQYGCVGAVVGATHPAQLAELRSAMPHAWFLVPGYGAQGGSAADVAAAFDSAGLGAVVSNSRGIIFAYRDKAYADSFGERRWQAAVEAATREMIDALRAKTPAAALVAE